MVKATPLPAEGHAAGIPIDVYAAALVAERRALGLYRQRQVLDSAQGILPLVNGRRVLSFCSNDYLGLAAHRAVRSAFQRAAARYGVGSGASHLVSGHARPHHQLEEELAEFTSRPRALLFSTGYMANLAIGASLLGHGDTVLEDRLNHASLVDAGVLSRARVRRYPHADTGALDALLARERARHKLVLTDGVFSMDGDLAPLRDIASRVLDRDAWLAVDDAHGLGVVGPTGRGTLEYFGLGLTHVPVLVGTLGKAFGTFGAFVAGSEALVDALIQRARTYLYTTALPPAVAEATRASLRLVRDGERRGRLLERIARLRAGLTNLGLPCLPSGSAIHALVLGSSERALDASRRLAEQGILVPAIRPPTVPMRSARLRVTLCADHTEEHVDRLLDALSRVSP
jgi:8-amino-7-oxononanoate synthase